MGDRAFHDKRMSLLLYVVIYANFYLNYRSHCVKSFLQQWTFKSSCNHDWAHVILEFMINGIYASRRVIKVVQERFQRGCDSVWKSTKNQRVVLVVVWNVFFTRLINRIQIPRASIVGTEGFGIGWGCFSLCHRMIWIEDSKNELSLVWAGETCCAISQISLLYLYTVSRDWISAHCEV